MPDEAPDEVMEQLECGLSCVVEDIMVEDAVEGMGLQILEDILLLLMLLLALFGAENALGGF